ncbi:hypothetical protein GOBAR_AA26268 [Gossypium barbadense]|uniref:Uncharacterized protein n=1 Tax=Gossypium barbadense TaxID=3634 RepID=A0A2P5WTK8_GOSBA|nr:hypothetical protein GOBAR_AA26268 [Gossypium barbadense]
MRQFMPKLSSRISRHMGTQVKNNTLMTWAQGFWNPSSKHIRNSREVASPHNTKGKFHRNRHYVSKRLSRASEARRTTMNWQVPTITKASLTRTLTRTTRKRQSRRRGTVIFTIELVITPLCSSMISTLSASGMAEPNASSNAQAIDGGDASGTKFKDDGMNRKEELK